MSKSDKFSELRSKAEQYINQTGLNNNLNKMSDNLLELMHELDVHQMELELQNRELEDIANQLQDSRKKYKDMFEFAPIAYFIKSNTGIIKETNLSASILLHTIRQNLLGKSFTELIHEDDQDKYYLYLQDIWKEEWQQSCEIRLKTFNGKVIETQLSSSHLPDENIFFCAVMDISSIQKAKHELEVLMRQQQELNQLQTRIITSFLHEIRTPLSIIQTSAEMIDRYRDKLKPEQIQKRFQQIYSNIRYLEEGTKEIIISENGELANEVLNQSDIALSDIVEKIVSNWQVDHSRIALTFDLEDNEQLSLWSERVLRKILDNIISNAVKYSDGAIHIILSSMQDTLEIKIIDKGRGIDKDDIPQLHKIMYRGKNAHDKDGMGVGLYTVYQLVDKLEGQVKIESVLGQGTTVRIRIPYRKQ